MAWGLAPLMITGLVAGLVPGSAALLAGVGALAMTCLTAVFTLQAVRFRRDNQKRYEVAATEARTLGKVVRVVDLPEGDFEYVVADAPVVERLLWPPPDHDVGPGADSETGNSA